MREGRGRGGRDGRLQKKKKTHTTKQQQYKMKNKT